MIMGNYHDEVMNIRIDLPPDVAESRSLTMAYKTGHRDARHAAAEITIEADQRLHQASEEFLILGEKLLDLRAILHSIIASADEPGSRNGVDEDYVIVHARLITEAREVLK